MPPSANHDDVFGHTSSRFLSAGSTSSPRKSPSRQSLSINTRRSTTSLRTSSLAQSLEDDGANGRHSLAHELAVALMPEPSAGSKLLAEEFGIEYDEGAEGIDGELQGQEEPAQGESSLQDELDQSAEVNGDDAHSSPVFDQEQEEEPQEVDPQFASPAMSPVKPRRQPAEQDPMVILAQNLEYTEKFLTQLRRLDADHGQGTMQPSLESLASDVIRRINDSARDREGQVRELLEYEREFRKIAGEVGGTEALRQLDALEDLIDESDHRTQADAPREQDRELETLQEESFVNASLSNDWEAGPDRDRLGDEEYEYESAYSPTLVKTPFPLPPSVNGPPTPANTIPQLAYLRTFTTSAVTSLAVISEHTQVNAAATTEAGRKIRALKNKLGGWRTEWDSAERSRLRIEKWEAGIELDASGTPMSPRSHTSRRVDGRKLVQEHLQAFEKALAEANLKTQAIMAGAS